MSDPDKQARRKEQRRRLAKTVQLPMLSGKASALILVACFVLTAVLIPMALKLDRWIEYEIVLAVWWLLWAVMLTAILYKRKRVSHDYQWREPRKWFNIKDLTNWYGGMDPGPITLPADDVVGTACLVILVLLILAPALICLAWVVIEVALPAVAFVMYLVVRGMLARVANDWHGCQGNLLKAAFWGTLWATVYTLPLALVVWAVHGFKVWHAAHYL